MFNFRKDLKKGFTLIELLVVIAIIGILASIVLVSLNGARGRARDTQRVANLQQAAKIILGDNNADSTTAFTGCITQNAGLNTCTNPAALASLIDPNGLTPVCTSAAAAACQFSVSRLGGVAGNATFLDWKIKTFLEVGSGPYGPGLTCISSATSTIMQLNTVTTCN